MKGISHFTVGVAAASFFPAAVHAAEEGNPLYFVLGGVFGLLPDTMDFKFWRFFYRHHVEVIPDPLRPDAGIIANAVAGAVNEAGDNAKPVRIKLNTIRMGGDSWRRYEVTFDASAKVVRVRFGPVVDTGGKPEPSFKTDDTDAVLEAEAPLKHDIEIEYKATTPVDILDGPVFEMAPTAKGRVKAHFIPWHRTWTHSLVTAFMFSVLGTLIWNPLAGLVIAAAFAGHILVDQLGFMGSSLLYPIRRKRTAGFKLAASQNPVSNFAAVWLSCLLIFFNLYKAMPHSDPAAVLPKLLVYAFAIPIAALIVLHRFLWKEEGH